MNTQIEAIYHGLKTRGGSGMKISLDVLTTQCTPKCRCVSIENLICPTSKQQQLLSNQHISCVSQKTIKLIHTLLLLYIVAINTTHTHSYIHLHTN